MQLYFKWKVYEKNLHIFQIKQKNAKMNKKNALSV